MPAPWVLGIEPRVYAHNTLPLSINSSGVTFFKVTSLQTLTTVNDFFQTDLFIDRGVNLCAVALITLYLAQHRRSYVPLAYTVSASPHLCSFLYFENIVQANACTWAVLLISWGVVGFLWPSVLYFTLLHIFILTFIMTHLWRSVENFQKLILSFYYKSTGWSSSSHWGQDKDLYPLRHLTGPVLYF